MKMDLTISRDMTINTGNYGNIKPGVTLTIKDFDGGDLSKINEKLSDALDSIMALEIIKMMEEDSAIKDMNVKAYYAHLLSCKDQMENSLEEFHNEIK